jgi:geranylgeranyl reductase family protein
MNTDRADVLVVGGGPSGSTAAFQLATAGIDVMLIDRATFPRDKTCGESLSPGALARLDAIDMWRPEVPEFGLPQSFAPIRGMRIRSPRGTVFHGLYKTGGTSPGIAIRRVTFDHQLLERARTRGVRVVEGVEATRADEGSDGAFVSARTVPGSTAFRIQARRVVVADGRSSFIARQLGFIEPADTERGRRRYAVRAHCGRVAGLSNLAEMHVGDGGYCGLAPLSATEANVCYVLFSDRLDVTPQTMKQDFRRHLSRFPEVAARLEVCEHTDEIRIIGPLRLRSRRQVNGVFIACGDATGFLDPFTGEGIAHAIASGVECADAVRRSLHDAPSGYAGYEARIAASRRTKRAAALLLYGLVSRPSLANAAAVVFAGAPGLANAVVRLFGDQI